MVIDAFTSLFGIASGLLVGTLSGMLGIGGGMIIIPVLHLAFGLTAIQTTATSLFIIIPTSLSGTITHIRQKTCIPSLGISAGLGGALTSPLGAYVASLSPSWLIMLAAASVISYSGYTMLKSAHKLAHDNLEVAEENALVTSTEEPQKIRLGKRKIVLCFCIGMLAGFAAGFVGVGGGFIMVPLFLALAGISMHHASGSSLLGVCILAVPGVLEQLYLGNVQILAGLMLVCGAIPGAVIGSRVMRKFSDKRLRYGFSVMLFVMALTLVGSEILPLLLG